MEASRPEWCWIITQRCFTGHFGVMDGCGPDHMDDSFFCLSPAFYFHTSTDLLVFFFFFFFPSLLSPRNMHYPPETSSIMLMARMVATVKQVHLHFEPLLSGCGFLIQLWLLFPRIELFSGDWWGP